MTYLKVGAIKLLEGRSYHGLALLLTIQLSSYRLVLSYTTVNTLTYLPVKRCHRLLWLVVHMSNVKCKIFDSLKRLALVFKVSKQKRLGLFDCY